MAMTATGMAEAIFAELTTAYPEMANVPEAGRTETVKYYQVVSQAIIDYVKANADVLPGSFNVPSVGAVVGTGAIT